MNLTLLGIPDDGVEGWKLGDHMELAGPIVVVVLFLIERILSFQEKRADRRSNWYYGVIVVPNLAGINQFFHDYSEKAGQALRTIVGLIQAGDNDAIILGKAKAFGQLSDLFREFEMQFLMTLYMFNPRRYNSLMEKLRDMRDEVIGVLDNGSLAPSDLDELKRIISNKKAVFYGELYMSIDEKG